MSKKYYKIEEKELLRFLASSFKLSALERGGVDNWSYYSESLNESIEEFAQEHNINLEEDEVFSFYDMAKIYFKLKNYQEIE